MLEELAKHHKLWLKILHKIGCPNRMAEDIVQEFYIKAFEKVDYHHEIIKHNEVNTYYIYAILRNMYISQLRLDKRYVYPYIDWDVQDKEDDTQDEEHLELEICYLDYLRDKINNILSSFTNYERQLYELHFIHGISQRKISRDSKVGMSSINNTIKHIKKVLRSELMEDAQDFYNQDYNFKI